MADETFDEMASTVHQDGLRFELTGDSGSYQFEGRYFAGGELVTQGSLAPFVVFSENNGEEITDDDAKRLEYVLEAIARYYDTGGDLRKLGDILDRLSSRLPVPVPAAGVRLVMVETDDTFVHTLLLPDGRFLRVVRDSTYEFLSPFEMAELAVELGYPLAEGSDATDVEDHDGEETRGSG